MAELYPLQFNPIFKEKVWGGHKLVKYLGKECDPDRKWGESWELSGVDGNISVVANGEYKGLTLSEMIDKFKGKLLGEAVYQQYRNRFPLLIKFIDAQEDLSIQVHPDDQLARSKHNTFGKTEMWYILQADPGASLITGFNQPVDKESFKNIFKKGSVMSILNQETAAAGDVFFIPAGRIHTIGKGILLAEIQQTSDITYRIYDFDRKDDQGNLRELHYEEALEALDYKQYDSYRTNYTNKANQPVNLASCSYFTVNKWIMDQNQTLDYQKLDSFVIYIMIEGSMIISGSSVKNKISLGDVILIPAIQNALELIPLEKSTFLEVFIEGNEQSD